MKGFKTVFFNLLIAILPVALSHLAAIDWTQYISPNEALFVAGAIGMALRFVTTSSVFKKE